MALLPRRKPSGLRVGELMTSPAATVDLTSPLVEDPRLMRDDRIHREVAVDERGRAVGVPSASDFAALYAEGGTRHVEGVRSVAPDACSDPAPTGRRYGPLGSIHAKDRARRSRDGSEDLGMTTKPALVADVMVVDAPCVSRDATLEEADMIIRSTFTTGLPVIDVDGVLVGVIGDAQLGVHRFASPMDSAGRRPATSASAR